MNDHMLLFEFPNCDEGRNLTYVLLRNVGHIWSRAGDDYVINRSGVDASELIVNYFLGDADWAMPDLREPETMELDSPPRNYLYYVPSSYDVDTPTPMVMVLHGRPGNSGGIAFITGMNRVAEEEGFIAVYPDAINMGWNAGEGSQFFEDTGIHEADFFEALINDLSIDLNVDPQRIYVTGFSNGGFMTQRLACEMPHRFAAFAVGGASIFPNAPAVCEGTDAVPIMFIHGTEDVSVPFEGEMSTMQGRPFRNLLSVPDTVAYWAQHNGCVLESESEELPILGNSPDTYVVLNTINDCADNTHMLFYVVVGGGHNWPGEGQGIGPQIAGRVNMDINANEVIWDFFQQYTLDSTPPDDADSENTGD